MKRLPSIDTGCWILRQYCYVVTKHTFRSCAKFLLTLLNQRLHRTESDNQKYSQSPINGQRIGHYVRKFRKKIKKFPHISGADYMEYFHANYTNSYPILWKQNSKVDPCTLSLYKMTNFNMFSSFRYFLWTNLYIPESVIHRVSKHIKAYIYQITR